MRIKFSNIVLLILMCGVFACEEKFQPELNNSNQNLLVVDGMISNQPGPYTIKLSLSSSVEEPQYTPLSGFSVMILDESGQREQLMEVSAGEYKTSVDGIRGIAGRKYKMILLSPQGKQYESEFEELRQPTEIEAITHKVEYRSNENLIYDIAGYRFYLDTKPASVDTNYYLWQLTSTYKYTSDFKIYWIYEGFLRQNQDYDSLFTCYKTETLADIFLFNTQNLSQPVITGFPLNYVSTETRALMIRYSLLVKQFSISGDAYKFWSMIKDQNTNLGSLYSKQPFQIRGNISNIADSEEIVLGQFMVAGVSEKRVFVNPPPPPVKMRFPKCEFTEDVYQNFGAIDEFPPSSWPVFATRGPAGNALPNQWCMDCRKSGGVIEKPEFWID